MPKLVKSKWNKWKASESLPSFEGKSLEREVSLNKGFSLPAE